MREGKNLLESVAISWPCERVSLVVALSDIDHIIVGGTIGLNIVVLPNDQGHSSEDPFLNKPCREVNENVVI